MGRTTPIPPLRRRSGGGTHPAASIASRWGGLTATCFFALYPAPMSRNPLHTKLISIIEPVLHQSGFELVDLRFVLEQGGWVLRVQGDLPLCEGTDLSEVPSDRVDLEDCETISRALSAEHDVEDPLP